MSEGNGQQIRYKVDYSGSIKQTIKSLHLQAAHQGIGKQFVDALLPVLERLRSDPHNLGEPLFHYQSLNLVCHHAIVPPLVVDFVIHEDLRFVVLKAVKLL